jgi:tape measure domain-containing protein
MYGPAIALGFGGYGLAQTNRLNQEVISAQLTTQAVTEAAGLQGQGPAAFDWLRQQGNRIGFSYMDQAQDYNNFLSNSLGAGMSLQGSQDIYLGFAEYARAMGITPARNKLVMNALSQMMGKGTVSMEELRRQMAESMPGTMDVFAQAYAEMTGSGLKGQEALTSLYEAIPTGKVKSAEILPIVQRILRERAAHKLDVAMKTSQAEQGRFQNAFADQAIKASQAGIEEGFSRIFRTLTRGLEESTWLTRTLANAFNEVTKPLSEILLFPQSFIRALDGRDSLVADWLGLEAIQQLREDWSQLKVIFDQIAGMQTPEWMPTLKATTKEIAAMVNAIAEFSIWRQRMSDAAEQVISDEYYAGGGSWQAQLKGVIKANWLIMKSVFGMSSDPAAKYYATRQADNGVDISPYMGETGFDPSLYWESQKEVAREQAKMTFGQNGYNLDQNNLNGQKSFDFKIDMNVDIKAANPEDFQEQFKNSFAQTVKETLLQYPETE